MYFEFGRGEFLSHDSEKLSQLAGQCFVQPFGDDEDMIFRVA